MRLLNVHILADNAARQWHADSGKQRTFILCEKKHEWVYMQRFHKFEKSIISASVTNVPECQTILTQASFHAVQNYVAC